MPTPSNDSGLRDNHTRGTVADFLRAKTQSGSKLSIVSAYFTIYAYDALKEELDRIEHLDFLFGEPSFVNRLDPSKTEKKAFIIDAAGLELSKKLQQKRVARECADWIDRKVDIKTIKQSNLLHGKMYHVATAGVEDAILGSSNFTVRGLGLGTTGNNIELNLIVDGNRDRQELKQWFDELWGNEALVKDVKQDVLNYLKQLYENNTPEFIYYKTLFHIFEKFLSDAGMTDADLGKTSLFETGIWKALFEFQKDGAKGAINKISKHNGCIIADSVGLGKTYEALAVIKYFELKNERVLVLCPKKLRENWTVYKANSQLNPFVDDRFRYDVVSHTDLSRETGYSGDINLATLNWGNYDLIVIDESHNFRNNTPGKKDEDGKVIRKSRYQRLMDDIIKSGVRTKVLLLSATPVNNDLKDLRNQLYFLTENRDNAFAESIGVTSLKETLATAQKVFTHWAKKQTHERKTGELLEKLNAAFFKLLDELTIARSRKHILKYYKATLAEFGTFPKREKPHSIYPEIDLRGRFLSYDKLNDEIAAYKLALFNPSRFVMDEHKAEYEKKFGNFTQAQREDFLIGMMKVNFLKRLESSVKSFEITMERTIAKIENLEKKIKNFQALPRQNPESEALELELDDPGHDEELEDAMQVGGKLKFHLSHLCLDGDDGWLKALKRDKDQLVTLYNAAKGVTPDTDAKLAELKKLIAAKVRKPTTNKLGEPNRKVLVFTAFADTATYLYESLLPWVQELNESGRGGPPLKHNPPGQAAQATLFEAFAPLAEVHRSRQNLPHWQQPGRTYFVTYRLADSIPQTTIKRWQDEMALWREHHPEPWDAATLAEYDHFFARKEEWLDAGHGSCLLAHPDNRAIIEDNLRRFDGERYILDEFVIMPNHVHVIVKPLGEYSLSSILHSWKSYTSKQLIKKTGATAPIWMDESFDHIVRSWHQLEHFRHYIRKNPKSENIQSCRGGSPLCLNHNQGQAAPATPIHIALVCGGGDTRTTFGESAYDQILTNFSPRAKHRAKISSMPQSGEIDLLIATDCISEGQNLQDCDTLINYDIHWNPVRIIQRFGRIDRIGSVNTAVHLVNFWPTDDLNKYINLKNRVEARMALVDLSATFADNPLENAEIEDIISDDLRYRDKQLLRLKDEVLDLEDLGDSVSLTEFTLDDFRLELLKYIEANKAALEAAPFGLYTCVPPHPDYKVIGPGVIFCFRLESVEGADRPSTSNIQGQAAPATDSINPLHPYFLVYVLDDGNVRFGFAHPKQILDIYRVLCSGKAEADTQLCNLFDQETNHGSDMRAYDTLLQKAVESLAATFRKRAASGLQSGRAFVLPNAQEQVHEKTDLELVTWLVIKDGNTD